MKGQDSHMCTEWAGGRRAQLEARPCGAWGRSLGLGSMERMRHGEGRGWRPSRASPLHPYSPRRQLPDPDSIPTHPPSGTLLTTVGCTTTRSKRPKQGHQRRPLNCDSPLGSPQGTLAGQHRDAPRPRPPQPPRFRFLGSIESGPVPHCRGLESAGLSGSCSHMPALPQRPGSQAGLLDVHGHLVNPSDRQGD